MIMIVKWAKITRTKQTKLIVLLVHRVLINKKAKLPFSFKMCRVYKVFKALDVQVSKKTTCWEDT